MRKRDDVTRKKHFSILLIVTASVLQLILAEPREVGPFLHNIEMIICVMSSQW